MPITKNPDEGFKPPQPGQQPAQPPRAPMPPHAAGAPITGHPPNRDQEREQRELRERREKEQKEREREQNERQRERGQEQKDREKDQKDRQKDRGREERDEHGKPKSRPEQGGSPRPREDKQPRPEPGYQDNDEPVQYAPNLPVDTPKEKQWQAYAVQAINGLYPRLRDGVDFAVGRRTWDGDIELLGHGEDVNIDWGRVEEAAKKLVASDPYADYKPRPGLATQHKVEGYGEVPPRRGDERPSLPPDIAQSEANPQLEGNTQKHLSQPYVEHQVAEDQREEEEERR